MLLYLNKNSEFFVLDISSSVIRPVACAFPVNAWQIKTAFVPSLFNLP
jgi:hypothetical protein